MKTKYTIKNFRTFNAEGATFDLTPITILTGCNSSGKSSMVKSLLLMKDFMKQMARDMDQNNLLRPEEYPINFATSELKLGSFDSVINRENKDNDITVSYTCQPECCVSPFKVEYTFSKRDSDDLKKGWVKAIRLYDGSDNLVMEAIVNEKGTLVPLKIRFTDDVHEDFMFFLRAIIEARYIEQINQYCFITGDVVNDEDLNILAPELKGFMDSFDEGGISYRYFHNYIDALTGQNKKQFENLFECDLTEAFRKARECSLFFYFPLFEMFNGKSKDEVIALIRDAKCMDYVDTFVRSFEEDKELLIADFQKSEYESFVDYFRSLEDKELMHLEGRVAPILLIDGGDFLSYVDTVAEIRYSPSDRSYNSLFRKDGSPEMDLAYRFLSRWQWSLGEKDDAFIKRYEDSSEIQSHHILYSAAVDYLKLIISKCLFRDEFSNVHYIGNFHSEVKRLYSFDDTSTMSKTIESFLSIKNNLLKVNPFYRKDVYKPLSFTNKWLRELGIARAIDIKCDPDGLGAKILLKKGTKGACYPLADEGYGISQIVTFLLNIEVEIMGAELIKMKNAKLDAKNELEDGAVPIVTMAIEEPEVSLHPSMQSSLADIFVDAYKSYGLHFIIETHSEYFIRRTQAMVAQYKSKEEFENKPFSVYYIENGGHAYDLEYTESGRFAKSFGTGFFDDASKSSLEILKRERRAK